MDECFLSCHALTPTVSIGTGSRFLLGLPTTDQVTPKNAGMGRMHAWRDTAVIPCTGNNADLLRPTNVMCATEALKIPNSRNTCHTDKTAQWAKDTLKTWLESAPEKHPAASRIRI